MHDPPPPSLEVITDRPGRRLTVLLSTPEAVVTESRYAAGQSGADPHVHRRHADMFHVVEGALLFLVGPRHAEQLLVAGQTVIAPPGLVHGFRVSPSHDTWYLNAHAPGVGFDVYLRERGAVDDRAALDALADRHDSYDEPADGGLPAEVAIVSAAGLVETWREWSPPGEESDAVAAVLEQAAALSRRLWEAQVEL